jgi:hypothetical protein
MGEQSPLFLFIGPAKNTSFAAQSIADAHRIKKYSHA